MKKIYIIGSNGIPMALEVVDENRDYYYVKIGGSLVRAGKHIKFLIDENGNSTTPTYSSAEIAIMKANVKAFKEFDRGVTKLSGALEETIEKISQWRKDEADRIASLGEAGRSSDDTRD